MLVEKLPRASHYRAAISRDVELYEQSGVADKAPGKPPPPDLVDFPPEVELLAAVYDRLGEVIAAVAASAGSKKKIRPRPWARPETARDILRKRRARDNFLHLEQALTFVDEWPAEQTVPPALPGPTTTSSSTPVPTVARYGEPG